MAIHNGDNTFGLFFRRFCRSIILLFKIILRTFKQVGKT